MEYLTERESFDWVYLVVSPQNPFKDPSKALNARARYEAAIEAVARHPQLRVKVDDIELSMEPPQYTIKTLDALRKREPENEFTLVVGADNLAGIHKWRDASRLLSEYGVIVYPRTGYDLGAIRTDLLDMSLDAPTPYVLDAAETRIMKGAVSLEETLPRLYNIRIVDAPLVDISSTFIREGLSRGEDMSEYLM